MQMSLLILVAEYFVEIFEPTSHFRPVIGRIWSEAGCAKQSSLARGCTLRHFSLVEGKFMHLLYGPLGYSETSPLLLSLLMKH